MPSLSIAQFSLRQNLAEAKKLAPPTPLPIPYPINPNPVPAGLKPGASGLSLGPSSQSAGSTNRSSYRVNNMLTYFAASQDLGQAYPDVPMGGTLDDVLQFAWKHTLPVFRFVYLPMEFGVVVYCWVAVPFAVIPLAFVYIDTSLRQSAVGVQDFFVYNWLINMPTQMSPLVIRGDSGNLGLISPPDSLWLPFIPPAPIWPDGQVFPPNPMLRFFRGGNVPVDASGLSTVIGAFV
jgi:hypothetical protein